MASLITQSGPFDILKSALGGAIDKRLNFTWIHSEACQKLIQRWSVTKDICPIQPKRIGTIKDINRSEVILDNMYD